MRINLTDRAQVTIQAVGQLAQQPHCKLPAVIRLRVAQKLKCLSGLLPGGQGGGLEVPANGLVDQNGDPVTDGIFTAQLDFGSVFDGTALYLEIGVRPDGSADPYTTLSPRQTLTAAPFAFTLRPGADVVGDAGGNSVVEARNTAPTGSTSYGLRGETDSTSSSVAGVYGRVTSTTPGGFSTGVRGVNEGTGGLGIGVWGSQNGSGWGVYGSSVSGIAVYGFANNSSATNYGVFGQTASNNGYAGFFQNSSGNSGGVGLFSSSSSNDAPDIILGGNDDGRLAANPNLSGSDLYLTANDAVVVELNDDNNTEDSDFFIQDGDNDVLFNFDDSSELSIFHNNNTETIELRAAEFGSDGGQIVLRRADGTSTIILDAELGTGGDGRITTEELQITGGADLSEQFEIHSRQGSLRPRPGLVVSIDAEQPGRLVVSSRAYERTVAGVISGAGGLKPGLMMGQAGTLADGQFPVALTGRVYVYADASYGAIQPGDLLTTSGTPGHVMKVTDHQQAQGAILGKAMSSLSDDQGLVLMLVSLQ